MKTIILFDPGIRSLNKGDEIIMRSAKNALEKAGILKDSYVIHSATHAPVVTFYQNTRKNPRMRFYDEASYKFICGSNLLWKNMLKPRPLFNVNLWNSLPYKDSILMGVGLGETTSKTNLYTKKLYAKILSKKYVHSTRDQLTADFLNSLGYEAINTGCPTMWKFTPEFCKEIPQTKASKAVFTLTDYERSKMYDQKLIDILKKEYEELYFWVQGAFDLEYFRSFNNTEGIHIISPEVDNYSEVLNLPDLDYVGTRLHAGMFAMQHKKRAIILAFDNRVRDMQAAYDLHVIERDEIERLPQMINSTFATDVKLKKDNIDKWLSQFQG